MAGLTADRLFRDNLDLHYSTTCKIMQVFSQGKLNFCLQ